MRAALFWGVCIPTRLYLASLGDSVFMRAGASVVSYRWLTGLNDNHMGFFGGPAFWADKRPLHGLLWGAYAVSGNSNFLYGDALLGATVWITSD